MMDDINGSDNEQQVAVIFQQICALSVPCNNNVYLIYQPNDTASILAELTAQKPLSLFDYPGYQIKYSPGLMVLDLADKDDQAILKQSIIEFYKAIEPQAILLAKPRTVYGWVFSSFSADILAKQLGKIAIQPSSDGDQLLRYFDPSVLSPLLLTILSPFQKDKLLNSVYYWLYLDGDGELIIEKNHRALRKQLTNHLAINQQQWQDIARIESRNQALARYRFFHPDPSSLAEKAADKIIFAAFIQANAKGYSEKRDLAEYAYRCLAIHPNFIDHPIIKTMVKQNKTPSLIKQLHSISPLQWDVIADECRVNMTGVEQ
ncbi:hypothetical protein RHO12_12120 [Orbus sturtevantii]|uniref:hypothetical protein n=1 Tax=Orbus sturtevantii TaxID=3074109 RepID=UPI00370D6AC2